MTPAAIPSAPTAARRLWRVLADAPRQGLLLLVRGYRLLLKPSLGNACRFEPTCSQYALDALQRHGAVVGASLTAGRLLRCHPWCDGGLDPVPARAPGLFTRLGLGGTADATDASVHARPLQAVTPPVVADASHDVLRKPVP